MPDTENENSPWCFRSETARLLALNVAQIHTGLSEGEASIDTLSSSFQQLANFCLEIQKTEINADNENTLLQVQNIAQNMSGQIDNAIMAFQFYDRLCQRLDHVQNNLHMLSELITDDGHMKDATGWERLRQKIKSSYTMETEHKMHEAVMKGASIEEALQIFKEELAQKTNDEDDIELF
mgnify:CR=1 FL=1